MVKITKEQDTEKNYVRMLKVIEEFLKDEKDEIANLSNISAVLNEYIDNINWVGFYILKNGDLVLGPFQGKPACIRIKGNPGNGVCFACVKSGKLINVPDVNAFPGHIACDSATNSEIVAPIYKNGAIYAVLDIDSPVLDRFCEIDEKYIDQVAQAITKWATTP
ncbi:MAG: GAF domain-containing protein [Defluviitaleaceae bacterium]|nr:GAF domain-containing protein [Defluviitaleaceae bacterium]